MSNGKLGFCQFPNRRPPICLYLPLIRAVEICLRSTNVRVAHQNLDGSKVIPVIQKGCPEGMPHYMRVNPLFDQSLFYHGFDKAVNRFVG